MKVKLTDIVKIKNYSRTFGVGDVTELSDSMKEHGQITPVILNSDNQLIAGFRRLAAAEFLNWDELEYVVNDGKPEVINLIENMNRKDLSLWEEIQAIRDVFGSDTPNAAVCRALSKSNSWVRPRTALWEFGQAFIERVRSGILGLIDIKQKMRADSKAPEYDVQRKPKTPEIREVITLLTAQGRSKEAVALSFVLCGITRQALLEQDSD